MNKKYPCYRLDKVTLEKIAVLDDGDSFISGQVIIDPDFDTLYIEHEEDTIDRYKNHTKNHKDI